MLFYSASDSIFLDQVESREFPADEFDHRAHLRLAYIYLCSFDIENSISQVKQSLLGLLNKAGIDPDEKYHETLTCVWVGLLANSMTGLEGIESFDDFIQTSSQLMDSKLPLQYYSHGLLFSDQARKEFVQPDLKVLSQFF